MKKLLSGLLVLVMLISLCACGSIENKKIKKVLREEFITKLEQYEDVNADTVSLKIGSTSETSDGAWDVHGMIYVDGRTGGNTYSFEFYAQVKGETITKLETDIFYYLQ